MEVADPELPSSKGVLSSLFGSHHSVVDREELCKCYHLLYCIHIVMYCTCNIVNSDVYNFVNSDIYNTHK